jgi:hypothetical protein
MNVRKLKRIEHLEHTGISYYRTLYNPSNANIIS